MDDADAKLLEFASGKKLERNTDCRHTPCICQWACDFLFFSTSIAPGGCRNEYYQYKNCNKVTSVALVFFCFQLHQRILFFLRALPLYCISFLQHLIHRTATAPHINETHKLDHIAIKIEARAHKQRARTRRTRTQCAAQTRRCRSLCVNLRRSRWICTPARVGI